MQALSMSLSAFMGCCITIIPVGIKIWKHVSMRALEQAPILHVNTGCKMSIKTRCIYDLMATFKYIVSMA